MFISTDEQVEEPVNLEGLKAYLSLRDNRLDEDSYLMQLVTTARTMLENEGGLERVIVPRSFELEFSEDDCRRIMHLYRPLLEVEAITYTDAEGEEQEITEYGVELGVIKKSGSWFSYGDSKLGQGRETVKQMVMDNPELAEELTQKIKDAMDGNPTIQE